MAATREAPLAQSEAESTSEGAGTFAPGGYESLLQEGSRLGGQRFGRLALGAGIVLSALCLLALRGSGGPPVLRKGATELLGEEELPAASSCTANFQNCISSRCCEDPKSKCFAKDRAWAVCKPSCTKGIDSSEAPELQTPWSCALLRPVAACSAYGKNCTRTKCCKDASAQCYYKDPGWAECLPHCEPGKIRESEPAELQTPWSCVAAQDLSSSQPGRLPKLREEALPEASAEPFDEQCAPKYGNCTERKCCGGAKKVGCYKRDAAWSECRESCPHDESWECSLVVTVSGPPEDAVAEPAPTEAPVPTTQRPAFGGSLAARDSPSLYCFSLMLPWGNEVSLIRAQLAKGVGIFSCDDWTVISNQSVVLSPGPPALIRTDVMGGSLKCSFGGEYHTALNSEIFYRVWSKVAKIGRFSQHDWTVKMDPDAVLLPMRLRQHVAGRIPATPLYINNCFEGLHGPIEVVSSGGMKVFADGLEHCRESLEGEWMTYGEDVWLRRCFGLLALARADDYDVLREKACKPFKNPIPCTYNAVSFHPLKKPEAYFKCLAQALTVERESPQG
mmetsp:Transcript_35267/g.101284  ORF Transcript_35267/g.101284 Transcript_35267/m.101284 type:complete len:562 (-) Transcript_35267:151-1836(-)